jgi:hypothetical protein
MLEHRITAGYGDPSMQVLSEVNGVPVRSLRHVMEILRDADDTFVEFEFAEKHVETLVFDREELLASAEDILADNGVRNRCSDSLRAFWP